MIAAPVIERIENAVREVNRELDRNNSSMQWNRLSEEELFAELATCIIGSRVTFEKATAVSDLLKRDDLLSIRDLMESPRMYERRIHSVVKGQKCLYARSKARYIAKTGKRIYLEQRTSIKKVLAGARDQYDARETLAELCLGIGLKQASLFLRNIHYADSLAILDTHVINYMNLLGFGNGLRKSLTRRVYLLYENQLRDYSKKFNTSVAKLDVSIWIVMRTVSREFRWML